jgi:25S rRNA (uracil2843-N3)-methyltransferase
MGQFDRKEKSQPKHGKPNDSGASKAPQRVPRGVGVPGWKGPGYTPKKKRQPVTAASLAPEPLKLEHTIPPGLEQKVLEIFRTTFPASNDFEELKPTLQKVNDARLRRDLEEAFGPDDYKEAYAIRWSPSRALGYAQILAWICVERAKDTCIEQLVGSADHRAVLKVVCFGGGAADMMAFSTLLRYLRPSEAAGKPAVPVPEVSEGLEALSISTTNDPAPILSLSLVDTADWTSVVSKLDQGLSNAPTLSKYASAAARTTNASFLRPGVVEHTFTRADALVCSTTDLRTTIGTAPALLTFMSTLNELYTTSMSRTTAFLSRITEATPKGSLLLVVDSPECHSGTASANAKEGEEKRKYPMSLPLDYALVPERRKESSREDSDDEKPPRAWEKIIDQPNVLNKLEESLKYPASLENLRFQVHLYKRV